MAAAREPRLGWVERKLLIERGSRRFTPIVIADEIRRGHVESDGNGRVRLRPGVLPDDVIRALGLLD